MSDVREAIRREPTREQLRTVANVLCELAIGRGIDSVSDWAAGRYIEDARSLLSSTQRDEAREQSQFTHETVAAYLLDRADQYDTEDWRWHPLADAAHAVMQGQVEAAEANGDLDDDLKGRVRPWAFVRGDQEP